jgi:hypothetical protein
VSKLVGILSMSRSNTVDEDSIIAEEGGGLDQSLETDGSTEVLEQAEGVDLYGKARYTSLLDAVRDRRKAADEETLRRFMEMSTSTTSSDPDLLQAFSSMNDSSQNTRILSPTKLHASKRVLFFNDTSRLRSGPPRIVEDVKNSHRYVLDEFDEEEVAALDCYPMPLYRFPEGRAIKSGASQVHQSSLFTSSLEDLNTVSRRECSLLQSLVSRSPPPGRPHTAPSDALSENTSLWGGDSSSSLMQQSWTRIVDTTGTSYEKGHDSLDNESILSAGRSIRSVTMAPRPRPVATGSIPLDNYYGNVVAAYCKQTDVTHRSLLATSLAPLHPRKTSPGSSRSRQRGHSAGSANEMSRTPLSIRLKTAPQLSGGGCVSNEDDEWRDLNRSADDSTLYSRELMGLDKGGSITDSMIMRDDDEFGLLFQGITGGNESFSVTGEPLSSTPAASSSRGVVDAKMDPPTSPAPARSPEKPLPSYMRPKGKLKPVTIEGVQRHYRLVTYHTDDDSPGEADQPANPASPEYEERNGGGLRLVPRQLARTR